MVGGEPQLSLTVALYRADGIVGQSVGSGVARSLLRLEVIAEEAFTGAVPQITAILTCHTDGNAIFQAVHAEGLSPAVGSKIEAAEAHRRGDIEPRTVR